MTANAGRTPERLETDRCYRALVLDLDGTLLDDTDAIPPIVLAAIARAARNGTRIVIATGRSELSALPILRQLPLDSWAVVYNGAMLLDPTTERIVAEHHLDPRTVDRVLDYATSADLLPVVMARGQKLALPPRDSDEQHAVDGLHGVRVVDGIDALRRDDVIRITLYDRRGGDVDAVERIFRHAVAAPIYSTCFPLRLLPGYRNSPLVVVDAHPPHTDKSAAIAMLEGRYAISAPSVVAVGDSGNDIPMLAAAGLGVAMGQSEGAIRRIADRIIGDNSGDALADLIAELFL